MAVILFIYLINKIGQVRQKCIYSYWLIHGCLVSTVFDTLMILLLFPSPSPSNSLLPPPLWWFLSNRRKWLSPQYLVCPSKYLDGTLNGPGSSWPLWGSVYRTCAGRNVQHHMLINFCVEVDILSGNKKTELQCFLNTHKVKKICVCIVLTLQTDWLYRVWSFPSTFWWVS